MPRITRFRPPRHRSRDLQIITRELDVSAHVATALLSRAVVSPTDIAHLQSARRRLDAARDAHRCTSFGDVLLAVLAAPEAAQDA